MMKRNYFLDELRRVLDQAFDGCQGDQYAADWSHASFPVSPDDIDAVTRELAHVVRCCRAIAEQDGGRTSRSASE